MEIVNHFSFHLVAANIGKNRKEIKKRAESNLEQSFSFDSVLVIDDEKLLISNKDTEPFEVFSYAKKTKNGQQSWCFYFVLLFL